MSDTGQEQGIRFAFCGNRFFILEEMIAAGLRVSDIAAVAGSYLANDLQKREMAHAAISARKEFLSWLSDAEFDVLIANGCPYRIPVAEFDSDKRFVNVHPSYLPDLRGADPVPGALLTGRDAGATCHLMDENFDTGEIISQIRIPYTKDLDAPLLYQLSFIAEKQVFLQALQRDFVPVGPQPEMPDRVYYSRRPDGLTLNLRQSAEVIVRQVRAFNNRSQGARFETAGQAFRVFDADIVDNPFLLERRFRYADLEVVFNYEDTLVFRRGDVFVRMKSIEGNLSYLPVGTVLARMDG